VATTCAQLHGEALVAFYSRYTLDIGDHSADDKTKEGWGDPSFDSYEHILQRLHDIPADARTLIRKAHLHGPRATDYTLRLQRPTTDHYLHPHQAPTSTSYDLLHGPQRESPHWAPIPNRE